MSKRKFPVSEFRINTEHDFGTRLEGEPSAGIHIQIRPIRVSPFSPLLLATTLALVACTVAAEMCLKSQFARKESLESVI